MTAGPRPTRLRRCSSCATSRPATGRSRRCSGVASPSKPAACSRCSARTAAGKTTIARVLLRAHRADGRRGAASTATTMTGQARVRDRPRSASPMRPRAVRCSRRSPCRRTSSWRCCAAGASAVSAPAIAEAYEMFPRLGERRRQLAGTLSGGEQRMLSLARVLVDKPRLLIADELSLGLAPIIVDEVYATLGRIRDAGTTLLIVEQHVGHALAIADDVIVLIKGEISFSGPVAELGDLSERLLSGGAAHGFVNSRAGCGEDGIVEDLSDAAVIAASLDDPARVRRDLRPARDGAAPLPRAPARARRSRRHGGRGLPHRVREARDLRRRATDGAAVAVRHRHQPRGQAPARRGAPHPRGGAARARSGCRRSTSPTRVSAVVDASEQWRASPTR